MRALDEYQYWCGVTNVSVWLDIWRALTVHAVGFHSVIPRQMTIWRMMKLLLILLLIILMSLIQISVGHRSWNTSASYIYHTENVTYTKTEHPVLPHDTVSGMQPSQLAWFYSTLIKLFSNDLIDFSLTQCLCLSQCTCIHEKIAWGLNLAAILCLTFWHGLGVWYFTVSRTIIGHLLPVVHSNWSLLTYTSLLDLELQYKYSIAIVWLLCHIICFIVFNVCLLLYKIYYSCICRCLQGYLMNNHLNRCYMREFWLG